MGTGNTLSVRGLRWGSNVGLRLADPRLPQTRRERFRSQSDSPRPNVFGPRPIESPRPWESDRRLRNVTDAVHQSHGAAEDRLDRLPRVLTGGEIERPRGIRIELRQIVFV